MDSLIYIDSVKKIAQLIIGNKLHIKESHVCELIRRGEIESPFLFLFINRQPIGWVGTGGDEADIMVFIQEEHRGQGHAKRMIHKFIKDNEIHIMDYDRRDDLKEFWKKIL